MGDCVLGVICAVHLHACMLAEEEQRVRQVATTCDAVWQKVGEVAFEDTALSSSVWIEICCVSFSCVRSRCCSKQYAVLTLISSSNDSTTFSGLAHAHERWHCRTAPPWAGCWLASNAWPKWGTAKRKHLAFLKEAGAAADQVLIR